MPNLVRMALTAAVLLAIAVRLRRRSRLTGTRPAPAPPPARLGPRGVLVAGTVAVLAALVFIGPGPRAGQSVSPPEIVDAPADVPGLRYFDAPAGEW